MGNFKHYVITRFNIKFSGTKNKYLSGIDVSCDEEYLSKRFEIFHQFTYPSMKGQVCKNFEWLVFFDTQTPEKYKKIIEECQKDCPEFLPLFIDNDAQFQEAVDKIFEMSNAEYIATTRIDNDDAVNVRFVEAIQTYIREIGMGRYAFGFSDGIQYDTKRKIASTYHFPLNHFTTMLTPIQTQTQTIYAFNHTKIAENIDFRNVMETEPMWLELVHGSNVSNRMHTKTSLLVKDPKILEQLFCCAIPICLDLKNRLYVVFLAPINGFRLLHSYNFKTFLRKAWNKLRNGYGE